MKYLIGNNEVDLFKIKYAYKPLSISDDGLRKKELRGHIPPAKFKTAHGDRLFSIEEIAMFEYLFKDIFPSGKGRHYPDWLRELAHKVINLVRKEVIKNGRIGGIESFADIDSDKFDPARAMEYIRYWRYLLLEEEVKNTEMSYDYSFNKREKEQENRWGKLERITDG